MAGLESQVRATEGSNGLWYRVIPNFMKPSVMPSVIAISCSVIVFGCAIWNWNID